VTLSRARPSARWPRQEPPTIVAKRYRGIAATALDDAHMIFERTIESYLRAADDLATIAHTGHRMPGRAPTHRAIVIARTPGEAVKVVGPMRQTPDEPLCLADAAGRSLCVTAASPTDCSVSQRPELGAAGVASTWLGAAPTTWSMVESAHRFP
jgi:hypothetical protein